MPLSISLQIGLIFESYGFSLQQSYIILFFFFHFDETSCFNSSTQFLFLRLICPNDVEIILVMKLVLIECLRACGFHYFDSVFKLCERISSHVTVLTSYSQYDLFVIKPVDSRSLYLLFFFFFSMYATLYFFFNAEQLSVSRGGMRIGKVLLLFMSRQVKYSNFLNI